MQESGRAAEALTIDHEPRLLFERAIIPGNMGKQSVDLIVVGPARHVAQYRVDWRVNVQLMKVVE